MSNKSALFFSNCLHHKKHYDRMDALESAGFDVTVVGYDWAYGVKKDNMRFFDNSCTIKLPRPNASTSIFRYFSAIKNILSILISLPKRNFDVVLCNSFEMLLFYQVCRAFGSRVIFDLADINPKQFGEGVSGKIINKIERYFASRGVEYVVTSPKFYTDYIIPKLGSGVQCFLIENLINIKINHRLPFVSNVDFNKFNNPSILWNGILRCNNSLKFLGELLKRFPGLRLQMAGDVSLLDKKLLDGILSMENVNYYGMYSDEKLYELYKNNTWVWSADLNSDLNSKLLLPNRVYQAIYGGLPSISVGDNAISDFVESTKTGVVIRSGEVSEVIDKLRSVDFNYYLNIIDNIKTLRPKSLRGDEWVRFFIYKDGVRLYPGINIKDVFLKGGAVCVQD